MSLDRSARIYVAGHRGLAGSAIVRQADGATVRQPHRAQSCRARSGGRHRGTAVFFEQQRPEVVFLAAARAGGILANSTEPVSFLMRNLKIQANVIEAAHAVGVRRMIFLGSSCIYPRDCPQADPGGISVDRAVGSEQPSVCAGHRSPASKCAGPTTASTERDTWRPCRPTCTVPGDNYDLRSSHVAAALIRKMHEAKSAGAPNIAIWAAERHGASSSTATTSGKRWCSWRPLDEARYKALTLASVCPLINVGSGTEQSISELAQMVARVVGFRGEFVYDDSMPDGTPRKVMDVSRMRAMGWEAKIALAEGLASAYRDFLDTAGRQPRSDRTAQ